jgi:hypothetical protein
MDIKVEEPALESISWFNMDVIFCENIIMINIMFVYWYDIHFFLVNFKFYWHMYKVKKFYHLKFQL